MEPRFESRYSASRTHSLHHCASPVHCKADVSSAFRAISPCFLLYSVFPACCHFLTKEILSCLPPPLESTPSVGAPVTYCLMYDHNVLVLPFNPPQSSIYANSISNHSLISAFQQKQQKSFTFATLTNWWRGRIK